MSQTHGSNGLAWAQEKVLGHAEQGFSPLSGLYYFRETEEAIQYVQANVMGHR